MKKLNKSLLAAAIIGAVALPGVSSAGNITHPVTSQLTHATDVVVNAATVITVAPFSIAAVVGDNLTPAASPTSDRLKVKFTLTGAEFDVGDAAMVPGTLLAAMAQGAQTGSGALGTPVGAYSASNTVFEFDYTHASAGNQTLLGSVLNVPALVLENAAGSLGVNGGSVRLDVEVRNNTTSSLLFRASGTLARSRWGVSVVSDPTQGNTDKTIDVDVSNPNQRALFSPNGVVGNSNPANPVGGDTYFNAGEFTVDRTQAPQVGGALGYVNGVLPGIPYSIVPTTRVTVTVNGTNLTPWPVANGIWLDSSSLCTHGASSSVDLDGPNSATSRSKTFNVVGSGIFPAFSSNAGPDNVYVCFGATQGNGNAQMIPQSLSATLSVDYQSGTRRTDIPTYPINLLPLRENGTTVYFQNVNPAGNAVAETFLRLSNHNTVACPVTIDAKDDQGRRGKASVRLEVPAHGSEQVNSKVLEDVSAAEAGDNRFTAGDGFGDGKGRWYVRITSDCGNFTASALNRNLDSGTVTNLTQQVPAAGAQWSTPTVVVP